MRDLPCNCGLQCKGSIHYLDTFPNEKIAHFLNTIKYLFWGTVLVFKGRGRLTASRGFFDPFSSDVESLFVLVLGISTVIRNRSSNNCATCHSFVFRVDIVSNH